MILVNTKSGIYGYCRNKKELHQIIDTGDDKFVKIFYEMAKAYVGQLLKDKMIAEGEEDIKAGKTHSLKEEKNSGQLGGIVKLVALTSMVVKDLKKVKATTPSRTY